MTKRLFVGGLAYSIDDTALNAMFAQYGKVSSATVIKDRYTNQSKGFGFVDMDNDDEAEAAIKALNETEKDGRKIAVSVAKPREERPSGGDRGGYNGGRSSGGRNY